MYSRALHLLRGILVCPGVIGSWKDSSRLGELSKRVKWVSVITYDGTVPGVKVGPEP